MKLHPDELVYGVRPDLLLDCINEIIDVPIFAFERFKDALCASAFEAKPVFDSLITDGYIEPCRGKSEKATFRCNDKMGQLAQAHIGTGIKRDAAKELLSKVLKKARDINADPANHPGVVDCIAVFGSFLGDAPTLGDLDLAVSVSSTMSASERAKLLGTGNAADFDRKFNPRAIFAMLRIRKPTQVSTHYFDELIRLKTPYKIVFGKMPKERVQT